jgi:hypothetical protein
MKKIIFSSEYDVSQQSKRNVVVSSHTMTNYFLNMLNNIGYSVTVVSSTKNIGTGSFLKQESIKIGENELIQSSAIGGNGIVANVLKTLNVNVWLFLYLMKNTKRGEIVLAYHGIGKIPALLLSKVLKKFVLCMYVGEIYHNIKKHSKFSIVMESLILKNSDRYIFSSPSLESIINADHKPSMVLSGAYQIPPKYVEQQIIDGRINIVYAGIIDSKKGANMLCDVAKYLPADYYIHIAGYGTDEDIHGLVNKIAQIQEKTVCGISYDGLLSGEEYYSYLQSCQIGICPQITDSKYNESSFPSKISVYMSNGLRVLVPNIKGIREHELGESLYYYNINSPQEIAKSIMQINLSDDYDGRVIINQMNDKAIKELERLIDG